MTVRTAGDLMVPLDEYPTVSEQATLADAVAALGQALAHMPAGRAPYRAVLVVSAEGQVIGKLGQLGFLKALEPKYALLGSDIERLTHAGVSTSFIDSMMEHHRFFDDALPDLCRHRRTMPVREAMDPITEAIDAGTPLGQAIHQLIVRQKLSLLVTRGGRAIGLLRLSDLFDEVVSAMGEG
jgi:CBS domain-containing protein